jgi:hypothetical protein
MEAPCAPGPAIEGEDCPDAFCAVVQRLAGVEAAARLFKLFTPLDRIGGGTSVYGYEHMAVYLYSTGMNYYATINGALWDGTASADILLFRDVLNEGLARLAVFRGDLYRGLNTPDPALFAQGYVPGQIVHFPAFTSGVQHEAEAYFGNVLFIIRAKTARQVWFLSADYLERELLIKAGTDFRVLTCETTGPKAIILLEEV